MNTMFGEWYRAARLEPKSGELELRWQGVEKHKVASDPMFGTDLVRLFLGTFTPSDDFLARFRQPFFDADNSGFRMSGNDVELRVLAAAVLNEFLARKDQFSDGIALILLAQIAPELRKKALLITDILPGVSSYLFDRSIAVRRATSKGKLSLTGIDAELAELAQLATSNPAGVWKPAETALKRISDNVAKLNQHVEDRVAVLQRQQDNISEEANIVWWLFSGANRQSLESYASEKPVEAALACARDLASLTLVLPPPLATTAYVERCLSAHATVEVSLEDIAAAQSFVQNTDLSELFPITSALRAVNKGNLAKLVAKSISKAFSLATGPFPVRNVALQSYRELLAIRFLQRKG